VQLSESKDMISLSLSHICFLAKDHENHEHLKEGYLYSPYCFLWESCSQEPFSRLFHELKYMLANFPHLHDLIELHLLTEYLLFRQDAPEWFAEWLRDNISIKKYFLDLQWIHLNEAAWHAAPVVFKTDKCHLRYFILGILQRKSKHPLWPEWSEPLMDRDTKKALIYAARAAISSSSIHYEGSFFCYPLAVAGSSIQFKGSSLGLPIAVGFKKLLTQSDICKDFAATGTINETGAIFQVNNVSGKIRQVSDSGFRLFLYPSGNHPTDIPSNTVALPVSNIEEAWMFLSLYGPGRERELLLMADMLEEPQKFVDNLASIPVEWIQWANRNRETALLITSVLQSEDLFKMLCSKIEGFLNKGDVRRAESILELFRHSSLQTIDTIFPLTTFKWAILNLTLANHLGNVKTAKQWDKEAGLLIKQVRKSDVNSYIDYCNHNFINLYHNHYIFQSELPGYIQKIIGFLEEEYKNQCNFGSKVNKTLGKLYGTIAQNFGFCGPDYLRDTEKYVDLSQAAFGNGDIPELADNYRRPLNYLAYAYTDSSLFNKAEKTILRYMGTDNWDNLWEELFTISEWHHALIARFFAENRKHVKSRDYFAWATENRERIVTSRKHPWQLWLYNLGRIACASDYMKLSFECFMKSLDYCLSKFNGPTVRVMALLPLSGLWRIGELKKVGVEKTIQLVLKYAKSLNYNYFTTLFDEKGKENILKKLWENPGMLFPFTYH
jgi:hypothetical protein